MKFRAFFLFAISIFLGIPIANAQSSNELTLVSDQITYKGINVSISDAVVIAKPMSAAAYEYFRKAKKINSWNVVWSIFGGYEIGAGIFQVGLRDNPIGFLDIALGGVLVGIPHFKNRKAKLLMYVTQGVYEYNQSLNSKSNSGSK